MFLTPRARSFKTNPARQRGQALVYGLFVLLAGLAAVFFMFNTGQLSAEKTKLVNTADAVAYSAGVMHARALNFDAYTNRALIANEVMMAQMISVSSWIEYAEEHAQNVPPLNCYEVIYSVPAALALAEYTPLCVALSWPAGYAAIQYAKKGINVVAPVVAAASDVAKAALQVSQTTMFVTFLAARKNLMQQVADANYSDDGVIKVDTLPITDNYTLFDGKPFIALYSGNQRARFKSTELEAAYRDDFVESRAWNSHSPWPCFIALPVRGKADRTGGTTLVGYDEWRASDQAALNLEVYKIKLFSSGCKTTKSYGLGNATHSAKKSGGKLYYSGVPSFYDLSTAALAWTPSNSNAAKRDPRLRFAIRLTRAKTEAMTSAGRSGIKPTGQMALFDGAEAHNVMAALATSEVFFERPSARADGATELASLFNPYWQVHLIANSDADLVTATALQN